MSRLIAVLSRRLCSCVIGVVWDGWSMAALLIPVTGHGPCSESPCPSVPVHDYDALGLTARTPRCHHDHNLYCTETNKYIIILTSGPSRKALTRGRTDRFVTYWQFPVEVCFLAAETKLLFPISLSLSPEKGTLTSCDVELWPVTLICVRNLGLIKEPPCQQVHFVWKLSY